MPGEFLVFQHVPHEPPGLLESAATKRGIGLDVVEFWKPYQIPPVGQHEGLIIMGGPQGVYEGPEQFPSKEDELSYIRASVGKIPIMGFCLGSQLLANALGARVYPDVRDGRRIKEIGFYDVDLTAEGRKDLIWTGFHSPVKVLQWHGDAFDLPEGAVLLATSPLVQNQAFRYVSNAYGFLFHREMTPEIIKRLAEIDREWTHKDFDLDEVELLRQAQQYEQLMEDQTQMLFDNLLALPSSSL